MHLQGRLGPLAEREYKRFFLASTISSFGDRVGLLALVFAVLKLTHSTTDLGLVLAARQVVEAATLVAGGVWSDRLPRQWILVGASAIQAASQATVAALLLGGWASVGALIGLQALYGVGGGLVGPATVGLVPQTVSPARLQQANALLSLSRNTMGIVGPALGGIVIVAASPALALAVDAATFVAAGLLLTTLNIRRHEAASDRKPFLQELRLGWREFASRTWLWTTVTLFGVSNFVFAAWVVLGPVIAIERLGGPGAWATVMASSGIGAVIGGLLALRLRPRRPLLVSVVLAGATVLELAALALHAHTAVLSAVALLAGASIAIHLTLWLTVFQQHIPQAAQSRVSSYDELGSFLLIPLGLALAGPAASLLGMGVTLWGAAAISAVCIATMAAIPSVRALRSKGAPEPVVT
ncbi:MAG TPA: MFS transporter [Gaiellaceae bacterium]